MADIIGPFGQYQDWTGEASIDFDADNHLSKALREKGIMQDTDFLVGFDFGGMGEAGQIASPHFHAILFENCADAEEAKKLAAAKTPKIKKVDIPVKSIDEFFALFRRFGVVCVHRDLELIGRLVDE